MLEIKEGVMAAVDIGRAAVNDPVHQQQILPVPAPQYLPQGHVHTPLISAAVNGHCAGSAA